MTTQTLAPGGDADHYNQAIYAFLFNSLLSGWTYNVQLQ